MNNNFLLGPLPNTYAFTKQLAEDLVKRETVGLPVCIHRPSIVVASAKEPITSWVDNIYGPAGLVMGVAYGLFHIMLGRADAKCNLVPVDYVINSCIASSYQTAQERQLKEIKVFNCVGLDENPIILDELYGKMGATGEKVSSAKIFYKYFFKFTSSYCWYLVLNFMLHTIPGYIVDFVAVYQGKKPVLGAAYRKIHKHLTYFTVNEWTFDNENTEKLWNSLNEIDRKNFPFNIRSLEWQQYFATYFVAMRELLMFDFLDTLEEGRTRMRRLRFVHFSVVSLITFLSVYYLLKTIFFFIPVLFISSIIFYLMNPKYK